MKLPTHVLNKKNRDRSFSLYRKIYPDAIPIYASSVYEMVWRWFGETYDLRCLPPPMIIDHSNRYGKTQDYDAVAVYGTGYGAVIIGDFYGMTHVPKRLFPHIHEIRLYTRAIRRHIRNQFDDRISAQSIVTILVHYFLHELHHFHDCLNHTLAMDRAVLDDDNDTMRELIQQYIEGQIAQSGEDSAIINEAELKVEERALADLGAFIDTLIRENDDPICRYGSQEYFDLANQMYAEALTVLELLKLDSKSIYAPISDEERDECTRRVNSLAITIANFNDYKKTRFVVID